MRAHRKILIIEDDHDIRESLGEFLELEGYVVARAENGRRGIEVLESSPDVGLVLLDLMMPIMDGWSFLAELERRGRAMNVPVIVMSALTEPRIDHEAHHIVDYFRKPLDLDRCLRSVETVLG
jgi:DNA-binding response OmpR family regulator